MAAIAAADGSPLTVRRMNYGDGVTVTNTLVPAAEKNWLAVFAVIVAEPRPTPVTVTEAPVPVTETGSLSKDYLPMSVTDLRGDEYAPEPWTSSQARFARSRGSARIPKGHPCSGKTTALLHAADESQAERVLYLTFSRDLAALARDYFVRYRTGAKRASLS